MITVNIEKAKTIAHEYRRAVRSELMKPLDVEATIPLFAEAAEEKRQEIRDKNSVIQVEIEHATSAEQIKEAMKKLAE